MIKYKIRCSDWLTFPLIIVKFNHFFIQPVPGVSLRVYNSITTLLSLRRSHGTLLCLYVCFCLVIKRNRLFLASCPSFYTAVSHTLCITIQFCYLFSRFYRCLMYAIAKFCLKYFHKLFAVFTLTKTVEMCHYGRASYTSEVTHKSQHLAT